MLRIYHGKWEAVQQVWGEDARDTLRKYEQVSRGVKSGTRVPLLSWSHHYTVASIKDQNEQRKWLEKAVNNNWSVATLRQKLSEKMQATTIKVLDV